MKPKVMLILMLYVAIALTAKFKTAYVVINTLYISVDMFLSSIVCRNHIIQYYSGGPTQQGGKQITKINLLQ